MLGILNKTITHENNVNYISQRTHIDLFIRHFITTKLNYWNNILLFPLQTRAEIILFRLHLYIAFKHQMLRNSMFFHKLFFCLFFYRLMSGIGSGIRLYQLLNIAFSFGGDPSDTKKSSLRLLESFLAFVTLASSVEH